MSGHQYLSNSNNLFEDDDVDDETFLKNTRRAPSTNPFVNQQQSFQQRAQEIEERTLASSNRSLGLLRETENVGVATAEELVRQREQLEKTNKQLDDINTTLRFSQKHLNGLKSVFGGLKNYIAGQRDMKQAQTMSTAPTSTTLAEKLNSPTSSYQPPMTADERYDSHPVARLRMDENYYSTSQTKTTETGSSFNQQLDKNLDEMAGSLSRLKGLAIDLHQEIDEQNDLIDDITNKTENVDVKLGKQNKEIHKLLGKK